jgi:AraC-like DNA-binding protein
VTALQSWRPRPPLDLFVDRIWWSERAAASAHFEHNLPTGEVHLIIALHDRPIAYAPRGDRKTLRWTGGIVHGPQSSFYLTAPKPAGAVMGVAFRPGAAAAVLGLPVSELVDRHVTLEELWDSQGRVLHERLASAATPQAAFHILEAALLARLRMPLLVHPAVAYALRQSAGGVPNKAVSDIQRETGYSAKHFIAVFRAAVGLTPKEYLRIKRFGAVAKNIAAGRAAGTLADLADAAGYADQSHMTREFRDLAGVTPTDYRPPDAQSPFHHVVEPTPPETG